MNLKRREISRLFLYFCTEYSVSIYGPIPKRAVNLKYANPG